MNITQQYREYLFKKESSVGLGLFRIAFGIVLSIQTLWFITTGFIEENIINPPIHFKFYYFQWLEPLSPAQMKLMMFLMLISGICITLGRFFKPAVIFFGLSFTYLWLLDKSYFNNHYYFISLMTFLMLFSDADSWGVAGKKVNKEVVNWQIVMLKLQVLVIFFIAGINKVNPFWLFDFQPMKHIVEVKAASNNWDWLSAPFFYATFSYTGLLFDLCIGFLLWCRKTRKVALILFIAFNLLNFWLFYDIGEIGFFPFVLLACLPLFYSHSELYNLSFLKVNNQHKENKEKPTANSKVVFLFTAYFLFQFLYPFRHYLYDGHVDWTGKGQRFSWRMKIMYKDPKIQFYVIPEGQQKKLTVNVADFLNDKQFTNLIYYPDFIPETARYIKDQVEKRGVKNPKIVADFSIGFMGRPKKELVDPTTDLSKVEYYPFKNSSWILK